METIILENIQPKKVISNNLKASVIELQNGDILKVFGAIYTSENFIMKSIEGKVELLQEYKHIPELLIPKAKVYSETLDSFVGYTMEKIDAIPFPSFHENLTPNKLGKINFLTNLYLKMEDIIKRANENDIIIPDLGTMYNIMIDPNKNMKLIDCDSWQVGKYGTAEISTLLGEQEQYCMDKYFDSEKKLFKTNLDKKSLALMYFITVTGLSLENSIVANQEFCKFTVTQAIDTIFNGLDLKDVDLQHKIWKLYQPNEENEYIGEDVKRIAETHSLVLGEGNQSIRKFKKR